MCYATYTLRTITPPDILWCHTNHTSISRTASPRRPNAAAVFAQSANRPACLTGTCPSPWRAVDTPRRFEQGASLHPLLPRCAWRNPHHQPSTSGGGARIPSMISYIAKSLRRGRRGEKAGNSSARPEQTGTQGVEDKVSGGSIVRAPQELSRRVLAYCRDDPDATAIPRTKTEEFFLTRPPSEFEGSRTKPSVRAGYLPVR